MARKKKPPPAHRSYRVSYELRIHGELVVNNCADEDAALARVIARPHSELLKEADPTTTTLDTEDLDSLYAVEIPAPTEDA